MINNKNIKNAVITKSNASISDLHLRNNLAIINSTFQVKYV